MTAPAAGWYNDPNGAPHQRYWDGLKWTEHTAPHAAVPQQGMPGPMMQAGPQHVVQAPYTMVTMSKKRTSHGLHLFLTIITFGIWGLFVWLPITIIHKMSKDKQITRVGY